MKTQQLAEIITDAVTDAVREALPGLVKAQLDAALVHQLTPALTGTERALDALDAKVHERITDMQADFATRAIAQADALTTSWERQVAQLGETIVGQVAQAVAGVTSPPGAAGPPGPPGPAGRDGATLLAPVHWKAATVFTRGALVHHRSGLWQAHQDTAAEPGSGGDGYTLVMDGHEPPTFEMDGDGYLVAVIRYASGYEQRAPTGFRPLAYVGVYDHSTSYHCNDVVTANGSMWVCKAVRSVGFRPGTDEGARSWQLAVKSGRDGRDGMQGLRGERGERGEPGPAGATRAPKAHANGAPR